MSIRSYSGLLVFEDIFDYIPNTNPDLGNLARQIFTPSIRIVEPDCHTTLGQFQTVNYDLEGATELSTGLVISKDRIEQLLFQGIYEVATRTTATCISEGGFCKTCYEASNPGKTVNVNDLISVSSLFLLNTDVIKAEAGSNQYNLTYNTTQYSVNQIFIMGQLQSPSAYTISGTTLTFTTPMAQDCNIVVHYYVDTRAPYLVYLAEQYSGAMLGMQALPRPMLPVRSMLLNSLISENRLELLVDYTKEVEKIPADYRSYIDTINSNLEKALYVLAINSIFANVVS